MPLLKAWESFYLIAGPAAAALIGLQFVVIALLNDMKMPRSTGGVDAFATPTVVHFCAVLLISGIATAPWPSMTGPAWLAAILGAVGVGYAILVAVRARRQKEYAPVFEDWAFHIILPLAAYGTLAVAALWMRADEGPALFAIAGAAFLLLFVGIHNAWDTVTYFVLTSDAKPPAK